MRLHLLQIWQRFQFLFLDIFESAAHFVLELKHFVHEVNACEVISPRDSLNTVSVRAWL